MGRHNIRPQSYVVGAVVPLVMDAGQQVLHIEGLVVGDAQLLEVEVDPTGLLVERVKVDDGEDDVRLRGSEASSCQRSAWKGASSSAEDPDGTAAAIFE